jgi:hypothetical protein
MKAYMGARPEKPKKTVHGHSVKIRVAISQITLSILGLAWLRGLPRSSTTAEGPLYECTSLTSLT